MLWIILRMLSIGSLGAFSTSVSRAFGATPPQGAAHPADGVQPVRANSGPTPRPEALTPEALTPDAFTPGLRLAPPSARPGAPLPRGSLLDLSV
jgi:hypothetical protein